MMKFFRIDYDGMWLGGTAIVAADSEEAAKEALASYLEDSDLTEEAKEIYRVREVELKNGSTIIYNDTGDY